MLYPLSYGPERIVGAAPNCRRSLWSFVIVVIQAPEACTGVPLRLPPGVLLSERGDSIFALWDRATEVEDGSESPEEIDDVE